MCFIHQLRRFLPALADQQQNTPQECPLNKLLGASWGEK